MEHHPIPKSNKIINSKAQKVRLKLYDLDEYSNAQSSIALKYMNITHSIRIYKKLNFHTYLTDIAELIIFVAA